MGNTKRYTLGFLAANINTGASRVLWPGVLDAAEREDVNLISFPGGRLKTQEHFEIQRNVIFDMVDTNYLDGIVCWASALAGVGTVTSDELIQFHKRYREMPTVSLAAPIEYCPLVAIDSYFGMQSLVSHLVDFHHYKKIALVRGPEGHPYALERYQAFVDILKEKDLSLNPELISPMVNWEEGAEAMEVILDDRGLAPGEDFQAVVAASDLLAIGVVRVLLERGIRVPADVAVAGFNDSEEGRLVRPPLTSVSLPFYEQGNQAVGTLVRTIKGEPVPEKVILDSEVLIRQSCGCRSMSIDQAAMAVEIPQVGKAQASREAYSQLVEQIQKVINNRNVAATWARILIDAFTAGLSEGQPQGFLSILDGMLKQGALGSDEAAAWQMSVSVMRSNLTQVLSEEQHERAENLFGQARILIGEAIQHAQALRQVQQRRNDRLLRDLGQELITTFDLEKLSEVLVSRLPDLGIQSCYLATYENPKKTTFAAIKLAFVDGKIVPLEEAHQSFRTNQLIPADLLPDRRFSLVVMPLFFHDEALGYAVFEVGPRDGDVYEVIRGHISSALKGALLFQEADSARQSAEHANQIKTRLLANVSHELRTPLNIILGNTQRIQDAPLLDTDENLELIHQNAEHLLRLINDLLDTSRAEINALDLYPELLDPVPLLEEAFAAFAGDREGKTISWHLDLPDHLPAVYADSLRLRQVLLNLLSNSEKFTTDGEIHLGAEKIPDYLHVWVSDTGPGIAPEIVNKIYEPFFTHRSRIEQSSGIGLGLSITKHLVTLHNGYMEVDASEKDGTVFHVYFPLPQSTAEMEESEVDSGSALWLVSSQEDVPEEVVEFSGQRNLCVIRLESGCDPDDLVKRGTPAIIVWDLTGEATPEDWLLVRRLQNHPQLRQTPFILFQQDPDQEGARSFTSLVVKPSSNKDLWNAIRPSVPTNKDGTILIIDDEEEAREASRYVVQEGLPEYRVLEASDGEVGLEIALADPPDLVILDLMMPKMDGFDVLDGLRTDLRTRDVPVVVLSARQLSYEDIRRLESHADVTMHSKDILSKDETIAALHTSLFGANKLPPHTSVLVKQSIAYIHQNYAQPISRLQIANAIGVSEDYLSRLFKQELGISPWDYLNRYRILEAQRLLFETDCSVGQIGKKVGISDASYFNRVFKRLTGVSPGSFRDGEVG